MYKKGVYYLQVCNNIPAQIILIKLALFVGNSTCVTLVPADHEWISEAIGIESEQVEMVMKDLPMAPFISGNGQGFVVIYPLTLLEMP